MSKPQQARIFVQIASYRDPECHATIADLFNQATHPKRVFVGICWQYDEQQDAAYLNMPYPRKEQVRVIKYDVTEAKGAGWARNEAQTLWNGEEYILQIQAHMRFEAGWDETLIDMLEGLPTRQAVLTAWLPGYRPLQQKENSVYEMPVATINRIGEAADAQMLHLIKRMAPKTVITEPFITGLWVGNFLFCRAEVIEQVRSDPYIYFWGEELNYSARLWTHGYDIYHLDRVVLYHYWDRENVKDEKIYRNHQDERNQRSLARNLHLFGMQPTQDAAALMEIEKYPLGNKRSIENYWKFIGVNWKDKVIAAFAREGEFVWPKTRRENMPSIFVSIASYRDPELQHTVASLLENAAHPDRIHIGICHQYDPKVDADCAFTYPPQVKAKELLPANSKGANWARAEAMALHEHEDYILQIDSHIRFEPNWDEMLVDMVERAPSERSVVSAYLPIYEPPEKRDVMPGQLLRMCVRRAGHDNEAQLVHLTAHHVDRYSPQGGLAPSPFVIANFMFAKAELWKTVPLDPHIYFYGDEVTMSARLWTHGINIYQPDKIVAYHYWVRSDQLSKHPYRVKGKEEAEYSRKRVRHLLELEKTADENALIEFAQYGLGDRRSLDDFWDVSGVDPLAQAASFQAQLGEWHMQPTRSAGEEIFVRIASYRDPELQATIDDLFAKAERPERIFVGVCCQFDPKDTRRSFDIDTKDGHVRMMHVPWQHSIGVCWARAQTERLWQGEEFTLQIDSHMRFKKGWDHFLIEELNRCPSEKPVISCNPARYTPPDRLQDNPMPTIRIAQPFTKEGNIRCKGFELPDLPERPLHGAFIAAGLVFSRSDILRLVPYDPYYYFNQEEITYSIRLWSHGFDVYSASQQYFYHYYNDGNELDRPMHWDDMEQVDKKRMRFLASRGRARFDHLTGYSLSKDPRTISDFEPFALGKLRSVAEYEAFTGIDFRKKHVSERALRGEFIEGLEPPEEAVIAHKPLEVGDQLPYFVLDDSEGKAKAIEKFADRPCLLFFLSYEDARANLEFLQALDKVLSKEERRSCSIHFVMDASVEQINRFKTKYKLPHSILADSEQYLAKAFGVAASSCSIVMGRNLKIQAIITDQPPDMLAIQSAGILRTCTAKQQPPATVITSAAPVLMLPEVFNDAFCSKLINAFETGETFDGTVGVDDSLGYKPTSKKRRDMVVTDPLLSEIDEKLARSVFAEIEKIYGFKVTHRELYKIGCYSGDDEGFFHPHRDNFEPRLGYRRVAMTINLSDDYAGGELFFPEYGECHYRPDRGGAIAFSCGMLHGVAKVTKGKRYVLLGFFHGEQDEAYRLTTITQGRDYPTEAFEIQPVGHQHVLLSRDFYRKWLKKQG